jgi:rhodanese-related sulfurtransferase
MARSEAQGGIATMPVEIDHDEVQQLIAAGANLLDVREREGYDAERLPGAVSLPIKTLDQETTAHLDRNWPVITYCWEWT